MAYFANGTSGQMFEEQWCERCVHYGTATKGCPVFGAHLLYSYELCNQKQHPGKIILDMLIPNDCNSCAMFVSRDSVSPTQLKLSGIEFE